MYIYMSKGSFAKYYQNDNERIKKKQQNGCKRYKNLLQLLDDERQILVEYRQKYYKIRKKCLIIIIGNYYFKN